MPRFVFELEAVLKQRLALERQRQLAVAALEHEKTRMEDQVRCFQHDLMQEKQELRTQLTGEREGSTILDLRGVRFQAGAALRLVAMAQRTVIQLAGIHKKIDAARLALLEAATKRKAVETLKDRRYEEWRAQTKRRENATSDELATMQASRAEDPL